VNQTSKGCWGCIARSSDGDVLFAATRSCEGLTNALHTEVVSMLIALENLSWLSISDFYVVFSTKYQDIFFREAKYLVSLGFIEYWVIFKPRSCNQTMHVPANLGTREAYDKHVV
jgi:hypothetical protein